MMSGQAYTGPPLLLDLGESAWQEQLDRAGQWFGNVVFVQSTLRTLAQDAAQKIREPHIRSYLQDLAELAAAQEDKARQLFTLIDREPPPLRRPGGTAAAKAREILGGMEDLLGGAGSGWRDIHQVHLACVNAMAAFGVAEQLGLALGIPEIVRLAFPVVAELSTAQLLLQEFLLEMAPPAILSPEQP